MTTSDTALTETIQPLSSSIEAHPPKPQIHGFRINNREVQTRFHFHMDKCIGCHSCEVACAEQNNLPADIQWRRVGEVEGGLFPDTKRAFLSSGCNHCLDAPCMKSCPVDAYAVDERGIIYHKDNVCIGCQYCTWVCPYEVPVFQEDRKIVTKCDLCRNRLEEGNDPACVAACPAEAITVEEVPLREIYNHYLEEGRGPDMPSPALTIPSTKITLPKGTSAEDFKKVDRAHVKPQVPHTPLILMTVLTQMAFGGFTTVFMIDLFRMLNLAPLPIGKTLGWLAPSLFAIASISLGASTIHLGRPILAYRAVKNWRTSWLSREVIALSLFALATFLYAGFLFLSECLQLSLGEEWKMNLFRASLGCFTVFTGSLGIYASSRLYRVPSRPAWNTQKTTLDFYLVAFALGPLAFQFSVIVSAFIFPEIFSPLDLLVRLCSVFAFLPLASLAFVEAGTQHRRFASPEFEIRSSAHLYMIHFLSLRIVRNILLSGTLFCLAALLRREDTLGTLSTLTLSSVTLIFGLTFCLIHRYLFFVTVVSKSIPGNFLVQANKAGDVKLTESF